METIAIIIAALGVVSMFIYMIKEFTDEKHSMNR
jgi:hypothetical protein